MRYEFIRLKNYIGLYHGSGIDEIKIDLNKCIHNKIIIKGDNGSGKSTLMNAIHLFPDSNINFIPGVIAEKELIISDNNIKYNIYIKHGVKSNGERETTKAYIKKINTYTGIIDELNPNGNVGSYKDIVFSEFMLDPNFISLSKLGVEDRGIVDKTPSERKRFVNAILTNLDVYNNIYKALSKKSSVLNSVLASLSSKLNNLGNVQGLKSSLISIEKRLNDLYNNKDKDIESLSRNKSKIELLDPNKSIQNKYEKINNDINSINIELNKYSSEFISICKSINIESNIESLLDLNSKLNSKISEETINLGIYNDKIQNLLSEKESEAKVIQSLNAKIEAFDFDINIDDLKYQKQKSEEIVNIYYNDFESKNINIDNINKEEFISGLNTLKDIKEIIDTFKSNNELHLVEKSIKYIKDNSYPDIKQIEIELNNIENQLSNLSEEYVSYSILSKTAEKLKLRPKNCIIDNCPFIKDAIEASKQNPENKLIEISNIIKKLNIKKDKLIYLKDEYSIIISIINTIKSITRTITNNLYILKKLPISNNILDTNILLEALVNNYDFKEIDELYSYIDIANYIEEYNIEKNNLYNMNQQYWKYESKINQIESINNEITKLNNKCNNIVNDIEKFNSKKLESQINIEKYNDLKVLLDKAINIFNIYSEKKKEKDNKLLEFNTISDSMKKIKECLNNINIINGRLENISNQISPLLKERDSIIHNIKLYDEYINELNIYKDKYEKINTIKKYSSPTTGIQTIFIEIYMNKTLELSNDLLSLLFNGRYIIGKLDINENEFKIPCIGNDGMKNDDISSMSTSEKCMISMIISFVLLHQSSTKFNILKLDEIDGGLDSTNRLNFLIVLDRLLEMLSVEQTFIISHNNELDLQNCDVITLRTSTFTNDGNLIYSLN